MENFDIVCDNTTDFMPMLYDRGVTKWYNPNETRSKRDYPYSYSAFFIYGSHDTIKGASADYTDRYHIWGWDKFKAAKDAAGIKGDWWNNFTPVQIQNFINAYYGPGHKLVGIVEWCNASNGYPCWSLHFKKTRQRKPKAE